MKCNFEHTGEKLWLCTTHEREIVGERYTAPARCTANTMQDLKLELSISDKILALCRDIQAGDQFTNSDLQGLTEAMAKDIINLVRENS